MFPMAMRNFPRTIAAFKFERDAMVRKVSHHFGLCFRHRLSIHIADRTVKYHAG